MIILAGTPIGNDDDASPRLRNAFESADLIAAEDTRNCLNLVGRLGIEIHAPIVAYHDHNESQKAPDLVQAAKAGKCVLVVSDAGMPTISDPGYRLLDIASAENIPVTVVPGPSAVLTALSLSGLPTDRFTFEGFIARTDQGRYTMLNELRGEKRTMIFFESPRRLAKTLQIMQEVFGADRKVAVCRELTKIHEEVIRGSLSDLVTWAAGEVRGEIVIVLGGAQTAADLSDSVAEVIALQLLGLRLKDAAAHVAERTGLRKNELYQAALQKE